MTAASPARSRQSTPSPAAIRSSSRPPPWAALALIKAFLRTASTPGSSLRSAADWLNAAPRRLRPVWQYVGDDPRPARPSPSVAAGLLAPDADGSATLIVNGKRLGTIDFDKGRRDALVWDDLAPALVAGKNAVELELTGGAALPYTVSIEYRAARPQSSPRCLARRHELSPRASRQGRRGHHPPRPRRGTARPMASSRTPARIGIPGGLVAQDLAARRAARGRARSTSTRRAPARSSSTGAPCRPRPRRTWTSSSSPPSPAPDQVPASRAYLYYTAEDKAWSPPVAFEVTRRSVRSAWAVKRRVNARRGAPRPPPSRYAPRAPPGVHCFAAGGGARGRGESSCTHDGRAPRARGALRAPVRWGPRARLAPLSGEVRLA